MKKIDLSQGSDEWLAWRKTGVTSTDTPVLLNLSSYKTIWRLWAEKVGKVLPVDLSGNPNIKRGKKEEDSIRQFIENEYKTGLLFPTCIESSKHELIKASLDGIDDNGFPWEIKAPSEAIFNSLLINLRQDPTFKMYEAQVKHEILACEKNVGFLVFLNIYNGQHLKFDISLTQEDEKIISTNARKFFYKVINNIEPEKDLKKDIYIPEFGDDEIEWIALATKYLHLKEEEKQAKKIEKQLQIVAEKLAAMTGEYKYAEFGGIQLSKYLRSGLIDYDKLIKENLPDFTEKDVEKYRKNGSEKEIIRISECKTGSSGKRSKQTQLEQFAKTIGDAFF